MAMASYGKGTKRRAKLVEPKTSLAMQKRLRELLGVGLGLLGAMVLVALWTYDPADPSLFSATDAAPNNLLGYAGASFADPFYRALGWASYGVPVLLMVWSWRFIVHKGETRAMTRIITAPIAIALLSIFAAMHVPFANWPHAYGLGGMFGDSVLRTVLSANPFDIGLSVKTLTLAMAFVVSLISAYALGLTVPEMGRIGQFLLQGLRGLFAGLWWLLGFMGIGAARAGKAAREAHQRRKEAAATAAEEEEIREEPPLTAGTAARSETATDRMDRATRNGYGGRIRGGNLPPKPSDTPEEDDERLMARITAAVKAREDAAARGSDPDSPAEPVLAAEPRVLNPGTKPLAKNARARAEEQPGLAFEDAREKYQTPPLSLLENPTSIVRHHLSDEALEENARMLETVLDDYGVKGEITAVRPGPVVTMYELEPAAGIKASRVIGLADDIARSMSALACRVSTIPGRIGHRHRTAQCQPRDGAACAKSCRPRPLATAASSCR